VNETREQAYRENNLGVAFLEQFKYAEAADAFRRALGPGGNAGALAIARLNLGIALLYSQDLAGASRETAEADRLLPSAPQPPYVLGLIARAENRTDEARRFFERVQQIDPHDAGTNVNLGQMFLAERQYAQAIEVLERAVADEPYNVTAVYNLGQALLRSGRTDEGQRMVERSQTLRTAGYAITYGTGYLEQGRYAEAIASTGLEPDLIDTAEPAVTFTPAAIDRAPETRAQHAASPLGRTFAAGDLTAGGARALAAALGGGLTLIDFDGDGTLDLFVAAPDRQRLWRNARGSWTDVTAAAGLQAIPSGSVAVGAVAADYDNDGRTDLFVLRYGVSSLYRNDGGGRFTDVTMTAGLAPYPFLPGAAAFVDVDHDGDLDLIVAGLADVAATTESLRSSRPLRSSLVFPRDFEPAPLLLLRNNANGTFTDITRSAKLDLRAHVVAIAPTDFDNRRDIDLLIVNSDAPPALFKNVRDGTFNDVATEVGLNAITGRDDAVTAVAVGDVNKDDYPDFFFSRTSGGSFALSDGRGRFRMVPAPDGARGASAAQMIDYDNDGLLDLLTWSADGPHLFRNLGQRWSDDRSAKALAERPSPTDRSAEAFALLSAHALAFADLDADGWTDVVAATPAGVTMFRNGGDARRRSLTVRLAGLVSNRSAAGAKIQVRAGSLSARMETSAATPAVAPATAVFGLGSRASADVVRVLWPSGIVQAETPSGPESTMAIRELDRKPSSCPFLYTWNGTRFEFVTDFLGGGELGYWEGPGQRNHPDPIEYVRIRGDQLQPSDGRFEIRVTNELEEALFLDRVQLVAIAHPRGVDVFPDEGMTHPPKPFRLFIVTDERVPARVSDDHGHDVTDRIARLDRRYPDDFALAPFRGYARTHSLALDVRDSGFGIRDSLGIRDSNKTNHAARIPTNPKSQIPNPDVLLLTGFTDYAFSSDNLAAHQAGLSLRPPSLEIKSVGGVWRTAIADIGIPVGRPQTIVVDLAGRLRPGEHEVRIVTNMRIYWDRIFLARHASSAASQSVELVRIDPIAAALRARGFSAEVRPDGNEPPGYDYARVTGDAGWKVMPGRYTREGDVRELLLASDDKFAIARPGDEIAIAFDAEAAGPVPEGWTRTFLLMADGFSKEMDINSASPDTVGPLPFHAMGRYPDRLTNAPLHRSDYQRYLDLYNTRLVPRSLPPLIRFHELPSENRARLERKSP
jgi:tetratricopeptide (TPR) repeat protein